MICLDLRVQDPLQFELLTAMILRGWDRTRVVSCFTHVISFCFCLLSPVKCYTLHIQGPVCNVIGSLEGSAWAGSQAPSPRPPKTACQLPQAASDSDFHNLVPHIIKIYIIPAVLFLFHMMEDSQGYKTWPSLALSCTAHPRYDVKRTKNRSFLVWHHCYIFIL